VRNIGYEWRDLAEGFLRVEALEARFRAEWGSRLERARRERMEAERQKARACLMVHEDSQIISAAMTTIAR
jgi:hypothetical protein